MLDFVRRPPTELSCRFTQSSITWLYPDHRKQLSTPIQWSFTLKLDKISKVVKFSSVSKRGNKREELLPALFAADNVQFPFTLMGEEKTVLVNLKRLVFEMRHEDGIAKSFDSGVCKRI